MLQEITDCKISHARLSIDPQAVIIEKSDKVRESKTIRNTIASTASGVGYATARRVMRGALAGGPVRLAKDVPQLAPYIRPTFQVLERAYQDGKRILLEGTQGTTLSIFHGYYPHTTSRDTTAAGCIAETGIPPGAIRKVIMVCRTYPIRVGDAKQATSGYMGQQIALKEVSRRSGIPYGELRKTERTTNTNRPRRIAEFDWSQLHKSALLNNPTEIALTFVDYICVKNRDARRYEQLTRETIRFVEEIERVAGAPVTLISTRFHHRNIIDRRPVL